MSHLSTLILRVKRCEFSGCPESVECGAGEFIAQAIQEKLLNIAEYMTYSNDYDPKEATEARNILYEHRMEHLLFNTTAISNYLTQLHGQGLAGGTA
jgi:hypothetical protein